MFLSGKRLCLPHARKLQIIEMNEIVFLKAQSYYTTFYLVDGRRIVMSKTLKHYESQLGDHFLRVHRSHLVHLAHVQEFHYEESRLTLSNNLKVDVSRRNVSRLVRLLREFNVKDQEQ